jgi:uncharacterized membrane protein
MEYQFMQYHSTNKPKHNVISSSRNYPDISISNEVCGVTKAIAILSYATLFGWLIAMLLHDKYKSSFTVFHLRQSIGLIMTGALLALVPLIGWLMNLAVFFVWLYAVYHAVHGRQEVVPLLGDFYQKHLDFIK